MRNASFLLRRAAATTFALTMATVIHTPELTAQPQRAAVRARDAGASMVERAIRLAGELELTQAQQEQLEAIRIEVLEERASQTVKFMTLTSEVRAGIREPEAIRQELAAIREGAGTKAAAFRARFTEVLNEDQLAQLREMNRRGAWRDRAGQRGSRLDRQRGMRRQERPDRGRRGRGGRGGNGPEAVRG